ncbi:hypothetical protein [Acinetobacter zhairhuonensis]|uniref:hypothetical protein n=1 Tax=Acinetobacter sp. A7.4 TaxID=2919921 RepID=UPI001F4ED2F6|nr:hypothetical protein [Acinetobacter sp. A7.4]MCJ8160209.1 hypothetical protein [Acinetobacter sp. A7.4]
MRETNHEIIQLFKQHVHPLSSKLTEMLNEHFSHQTERRGCGYTQATRVLADYINSPRLSQDFVDLKLFDQFDSKTLKTLLEQSQFQISDWHNLDQNPAAQALPDSTASELKNEIQQHISLQQQLRNISTHAQLEESKLLCDLISDIILPRSNTQTGLVELTALSEKPKVGSCPMAENFFLKIAHGRMLRQGEINIFVDEQQQPILLEKLNMGDNHSCISLKPVLMNGVCLPAGSLFSVDYDRDLITDKIPNQKFKGFVLPYSAINGFWFLRLTTLAVSPENRARAFTTHYQQQVDNGLFSPGTTQLQQLQDIALMQIQG